ncbi:hypothetical protein OH540_12385 [Streptomyces sp. BPPL-273]|uniref:methylation-associated defense system protein MAD4 n=1 Tax=Streptomyces sp. BPPL-273 TaxID=2987533 RepID=UPI0024AEB684|nr:hypothetical protein [Streptomyces sp. BPPL-273]WHM30793.1 hypothetical protein OH540_12385 [Streptomyces sp. BPPL-273]
MPRQAAPVDESTKRELVFLVADKGMEAMIGTFLGRQDFHHRLGCARFDFDPKTDIKRAGGHDPGLVKREAAVINRWRSEYHRAIVVVDNAYNGSPGPDRIRELIGAQLAEVWEQFEVICIDPELENWFWVDSQDHVKRALLWNPKHEDSTPREVLEAAGLWEPGSDKPRDPKHAVEWLRAQRYTRAPVDNGIFARLARDLRSVRRCTDESFRLLTATLTEWFPAQGATAAGTYGTHPIEQTEPTL